LAFEGIYISSLTPNMFTDNMHILGNNAQASVSGFSHFAFSITITMYNRTTDGYLVS